MSKLMAKLNPRRLWDDDEPDGYMESDRDFMANNREVCVAFLELALKHGSEKRAAATMFRICHDGLHELWDMMQDLEDQEWATPEGNPPSDVEDVIIAVKHHIENVVNKRLAGEE